jgi:hypothetical protein
MDGLYLLQKPIFNSTNNCEGELNHKIQHNTADHQKVNARQPDAKEKQTV